MSEPNDRPNLAHTPAIERVARVLAGQRLSASANGDIQSASAAVDADWPQYQGDAIAVLKTLREPDQRMAEAGDAIIWERMVLAALGEDRAAPASGDFPR